jgi:RecB family exonuclease
MAGPVLRVFPDAERVDAALREASRISAAAGVGVVDASGFVGFAELLALLTGGAERMPCAPLEARATVMALMARREGPFGGYGRSSAFARAAVELFEELKLGGAGASELGAAGRTLGGRQRDRLHFLGELFLDYQKALRTRGWADRADRIQQATEALEAGLPTALRRFKRIELSGLYDFPTARLGLVLALWRACDRDGVDFLWELPAGLSPGVDVAVDGLLGAVERVGQELAGGQVSKADLDAEGRPLAWLGRVLFSDEETAPRPSPLERVSAPSVRAECVEIARRVRRWIDEGAAPGDIAIAYRDLGGEAETLEEALAELGVRGRARRGVPLGATATGRAFLSLPGLLDDGFRAEAVAALLAGGRLSALVGRVPDAPLKWFVRAGLRDDLLGDSVRKGAYVLRLGGLADRLRAGKDGAEAHAARRLLETCQRLFKACQEIPEEGSALAMVAGWRRAIGALGIGATAADFDPLETPAPILRALATEQRAREALAGMAAALVAVLEETGAGAQRIRRRELQDLLWDAAADVNLAGAGGPLGAVRILELRELVGQRFEHVALGGFHEGRFPSEASRGGLLSDEERFAVNQAAKRDVFRSLAGEQDGRLRWGLAEDRLLLFQALAAAQTSAWVSFARVGADGRPSRPSAFFEELGRRVAGPVQILPAQVAPSLDAVQSERELRTRLALEAAVRPELRLSTPELEDGVVAGAVTEPWLVEALRLAGIEAERQRFFANEACPPGPFSGALTGLALERTRAKVAFGPDHPLSASALGVFGNCRFQGLLKNVLRLGSLEEVGEDLDARTRGTFWHAVLRELFQALGREGLLGKGADEVPEVLIDEAVRIAVAELERSAPVGHAALWALSQERAKAMVRRVLDAEDHGLPFGGTRVFSELAFGTKDAQPPFSSVRLQGTVEEGDVYLRGAIDRFDVAEDGGGVVDFKAKRLEKSTLAENLLVSDFQLPFYLHAVRSGGHGATRRAGWMSLREAKVIELDEVLAKEGTATVDDLLETEPARRQALASAGALNLANTVHGLLRAVRSGDVGPRAHDCAYCEYRAVCRVGAARGAETDEGAA